jgi:hypothetical protein
MPGLLEVTIFLVFKQGKGGLNRGSLHIVKSDQRDKPLFSIARLQALFLAVLNIAVP